MKSLQEQAYQHLKEMVLSGEFKKDQFYSETRTASELGISRTPVRNALLRLEHEGFIEIFPSKGYRVRIASKKDIISLYQLRAAIEGYASYYVANGFDDDEKTNDLIDKLKANLEQQRLIVEGKENIAAFAELDYAFHRIIVDAVENNEFNKIADSYNHKIQKFLSNFLLYPNRAEVSYKEHLILYSCIAEGEAEKAFDFASIHLRASEYVTLRDAEEIGPGKK